MENFRFFQRSFFFKNSEQDAPFCAQGPFSPPSCCTCMMSPSCSDAPHLKPRTWLIKHPRFMPKSAATLLQLGLLCGAGCDICNLSGCARWVCRPGKRAARHACTQALSGDRQKNLGQKYRCRYEVDAARRGHPRAPPPPHPPFSAYDPLWPLRGHDPAPIPLKIGQKRTGTCLWLLWLPL